MWKCIFNEKMYLNVDKISQSGISLLAVLKNWWFSSRYVSVLNEICIKNKTKTVKEKFIVREY